jgi:hypothetical protein
MTTILRAGACAVVSGAVLVVSCVLVSWLGGPSLLPGDLPRVLKQLVEEMSRSDELNERNPYNARVMKGKEEVTQDVVAGRTSLPEAIARLRELYQLAADWRQNSGAGSQTADTSDEAVARNLLAWVRVAVVHHPNRDEVLRRVEEEFHRAFPNARPEE